MARARSAPRRAVAPPVVPLLRKTVQRHARRAARSSPRGRPRAAPRMRQALPGRPQGVRGGAPRRGGAALPQGDRDHPRVSGAAPAVPAPSSRGSAGRRRRRRRWRSRSGGCPTRTSRRARRSTRRRWRAPRRPSRRGRTTSSASRRRRLLHPGRGRHQPAAARAAGPLAAADGGAPRGGPRAHPGDAGLRPLLQDAHNARIHGKERVEHVGRFRRLLGDPTDGQKWWDAAIHGFNARRCYDPARWRWRRSSARRRDDASRGAFFLLFHAWQQTCDWRDYDKRLRAIEFILEASLAQMPPPRAASLPGRRRRAGGRTVPCADPRLPRAVRAAHVAPRRHAPHTRPPRLCAERRRAARRLLA